MRIRECRSPRRENGIFRADSFRPAYCVRTFRHATAGRIARGVLEIWRFGDLEIWRFGDFSCRSIPFAPLSVAGIPKPFRMEALCRTADFFRGLPEGEGNRVKNIWSGSEVKNDGPVGSRRYFRYFYGSAKKRGGSRSRTRDSDCREAVRSARMRRYGVFRTNRRPN